MVWICFVYVIVCFKEKINNAVIGGDLCSFDQSSSSWLKDGILIYTDCGVCILFLNCCPGIPFFFFFFDYINTDKVCSSLSCTDFLEEVSSWSTLISHEQIKNLALYDCCACLDYAYLHSLTKPRTTCKRQITVVLRRSRCLQRDE